jgi:hypothetical protein
MLGRGEDLLDRPALDDDSLAHHGDVVGQVRHDTHVMRDEQDGAVQSITEAPQEIEDLGLHRYVERRCRLVSNEQLGITRDRLGDHGALPLAAGKLVRIRVICLERIGQFDHLEQLERARLRIVRRHPEVNAQRLHDLGSDRVHRVERCHRLLEDHCDLSAAHPAHLLRLESGKFATIQLEAARNPAVLWQQVEQRHGARTLARS